ncbi:response regulator transcription factor [Sphingomonas psychrolutea]|uniref:DNA-binding response regulator n=1 Tax=Sphingomonas psychrolutea TaxID=1259676 RepID=A0ABQ1H6T7_9SPHN|nr:response regulator transcription factor [Sphingomonas psychrolutea]GGA61257.1 DNA-binding response regulator [Sphingomonas psychrolutea]
MTLPFLVIVEDDEAFARTLRRSFERRGYEIALAPDFATLNAVIAERAPDFAVVDLKLGADSGLVCVAAIHASAPDATIVVLTGYASIATAVEAIKLGAANYLPKPSNTDDIIAAFAKAGGDAAVPVVGRSTSIKTLEWEHIHQTLADTGFNISETARRLGMHRRTLARKLEKQQVK